jgi:hypothetical protein
MSETAAGRLAGFIAKFDPAMQKRIKAARAAMRRRLPSANELVYDNYNFFVIGYSASERPSDCLLSLAANAKGIVLSFYYGSSLPDPAGVLQGSGSQNRFIRLESAAMLQRPEVEGSDHAVVITVRDDGAGIPEAELSRIFLPFYRVDRARSRKTGGYGLGLSICQRIAEAHSGTLVARARAPRGTDFVVTIPMP